MEHTGRLFIAAELPEQMMRELQGTAECLKTEVRAHFTQSENYHITLAFLGETDLALRGRIQTAMRKGTKDLYAFPVRFDRLGYFGKRDSAVLWCGIKNAQPIIALANKIRAELAEEGIWFDEKSVRPHITLARQADLRGGAWKNTAPQGKGEISRITLFQSLRQGGRLIYQPLYCLPLEKDVPEKSRHSVKVVAAVIEKDGKVLICRRKNKDGSPGKWEFPGGKQEQGEREEDCLARELREELCLTVLPGKTLWHVRHDYEAVSVDVSFRRAKILAGEMRLMVHADARWVETQRLREYDFLEADLELIAKMAEGML